MTNITTTEAARILKIDASQVRRYCGAGKLPATKVGRDWIINMEDAQKFVKPREGRPRKNVRST